MTTGIAELTQNVSKSVAVAAAASFGGLATVLTLLPLSFPFPVIPYLKFDVAEIPVVVAFLGFGPAVGLCTSAVYWAALTLVGEWTPIGPLMKFLAVCSMLLGMWLGSKLFSSMHGGSLLSFMLLTTSFGALARVAVTSALNYVVIVLMFPFFLDIAAGAVAASIGLRFASPLGALIAVLVFTAIYNIIHTAVSILPSAAMVHKVAREGVFLRVAGCWMNRMMARR